MRTIRRRRRQELVDLPAGSTWLTFTDQVGHAAMAGQYQFEQTFLLPVSRDARRRPIAASRARATERPATGLTRLAWGSV